MRAWGLPKANEDAGAVFDKHQKDMVADCIEFNLKSGLYQKCLAYQYAAVHEFLNEEIKAAKPKFPAGMELDDYSAGFVRRDGVTPKPVLQFVIDSNPNGQARLSKSLHVKVVLRPDNKWNPTSVTLNSDYPVAISLSNDVRSSAPAGSPGQDGRYQLHSPARYDRFEASSGTPPR